MQVELTGKLITTLEMQMPTTPHDVAADVLRTVEQNADLNEADTRHRIIDRTLHEVLCWPRTLTKCEPYIAPGYADYVLVSRRDVPILFIEAKKKGHYFTLPTSFNSDCHYRFVKVKTLMTDKSTKAAIEQVRQYCADTGCEHAAITNGNQWIFFKIFQLGKRWQELQAFVVEHYRYFVAEFLDANNRLSYVAIDEQAALDDLFGDPICDRRQVFYPKVKIESYDQEVFRNHLARSVRPVIERYFGKMDPHDDQFMRACYISRREYKESEQNVQQVIDDTLSPFFRDYNVAHLFEEQSGGEFFQRIPSGARDKKSRDVIVLFGGKGSGKSTLASRLLYHRPPNSIKHFSVPVVVDLLECPEDKTRILEETYSQLIDKIDTENLLTSERDTLLDLFDDRYSLAKKQDLAGLLPESPEFNTRLNELVKEWKSDALYVASKISDYWKKHRKGVIVVLDNTDQYSPDVQEYCFTLAQMLATKLDCLIIISMREERFYVSKIAGTLDAFHNSGFHLTSPPPRLLFERRISYVRTLLRDVEKIRSIAPEMSETQRKHLRVLMRIFKREFRSDNSHLAEFIRACAHGNMRLALDFFREFVLSGYTRVDEMLRNPRWTLQIHQVLRPMMVPYRFFYDERKSAVPNLFQIRSPERGSNLTGLRLLKFLSRGQAATNPSYVPMAKVRDYFGALNMLDDAEQNLDVFLKTGIVESNKRIDYFDEAIDAIKITAYGIYLAERLSHNFAYLELVCLDCGVHDEAAANDLATCGNDDIAYFFSHDKARRMDVRIGKVRAFLDYLTREEELEHTYFFPEVNESKIVPELRRQYEIDKDRVLKSARRNFKTASSEDVHGEFDFIDAEIDNPDSQGQGK